ncbi:MAG: hypothetical protein KBA46_05520 [Candidatus Omnitrophica bacterium]|nr:hypothetical protein [Candidatus Omnitrophota bacterium]
MNQHFITVFLLIVLVSIFDTINQLFLKSAVNAVSFSPSFSLRALVLFLKRLLMIPRLWLSFIFSTCSLCVWLIVLSKAELNFAFSIDSMHYVFIAFGAGVFLKEPVGLRRWIGTSLVVLGIALVSIS